MFEENRMMRLEGGNFDGTLADMLAANPQQYTPAPPGYAKFTPAPRRGGGGREVPRGGGRDGAQGSRGRGGRDGDGKEMYP